MFISIFYATTKHSYTFFASPVTLDSIPTWNAFESHKIFFMQRFSTLTHTHTTGVSLTRINKYPSCFFFFRCFFNLFLISFTSILPILFENLYNSENIYRYQLPFRKFECDLDAKECEWWTPFNFSHVFIRNRIDQSQLRQTTRV